MGHQICKQPDGKLAIFSDGTNAWIMADATPEEVVEYYAERAAQQARESAQRTVDNVMADQPRKSYYQFTETFAALNAMAKASGSTVLPGPVDEVTYHEWARDDTADSMDNHLIFGAGEH